MDQETYLQVHARLMARLRMEMRRKNYARIRQSASRLHRFRKRYQRKFAA